MIWDKDGPNRKKPLQFRVPTGNEVNFMNSFRNEKEVVGIHKIGKNSTDAELLRYHDQLKANGDVAAVLAITSLRWHCGQNGIYIGLLFCVESMLIKSALQDMHLSSFKPPYFSANVFGHGAIS